VLLDIPGFKLIDADNLVLDFNGTIAQDGVLIPGVEYLLNKLSNRLHIYVLTADTFGTVRDQLKNTNCDIFVISRYDQCQEKESFLLNLGCEKTIAIGNGRNDKFLIKNAALGICVIQAEGAASKSVFYSDIIFTSIIHALESLLNDKRLTATLRS